MENVIQAPGKPKREPHPKSIQAFCLRHGVCRATVYNQHNAGLLAFKKVGNRSLILPEEEAAWLARDTSSDAMRLGAR